MNKDVLDFINHILRTDIQQLKVKNTEESIEFTRFNKGNESVLSERPEILNESIEDNISESETDLVVTAPMVGLIHINNGLKVGDSVKRGDALGQIESMKVFSDVISPYEGTLKEVKVAEGDAVEFEQMLFLLKSDGEN
ncbi:acetyl-CoA carboxylase biotin carboxyl carrier protein [Pediococcus acidilactici]|uniref:acetyl-CoA carboxylase biotin carboxyl carrier protein n=1 Tax=Pediococcus acidilactici TaxID=1254 RepID=UPI003A921A37